VRTDLLTVVSGLPPAAVREAVPPACRRDAVAAPAPRIEGLDVVVDLGPWRPRAPVRHLVPALSLLSAEPYAFRFELAGCRAGAWTPWVATVTVGDADFAPLPAAVDGLSADIDLWTAADPVEAVHLRLRLRAEAPDRVLGAPWLLTLSASDLGPLSRPAPKPRSLRLEVPPLSQAAEAPEVAARICSPTCVAMVLAHFGVRVGPGLLAAEVFHPGLDRYGVWPAAIGAGARRGLLGYLLRFPDWASAAWCLERGLPVVASVRYEAGELPGAPLVRSAGHLVVLTGYEGDDVLVNDPAASEVSGVRRRYRLTDLARVWLERAGVGYVFFPAPQAPAARRKRGEPARD
jgi:hypothetical protein